jgi:hypothetical protein
MIVAHGDLQTEAGLVARRPRLGDGDHRKVARQHRDVGDRSASQLGGRDAEAQLPLDVLTEIDPERDLSISMKTAPPQ